MKLMIASDIHGSAFYARGMAEAFQGEAADRLLLLGDILYHGPRNDLPREYDPKAVIGLLNAFPAPIYCVRGNCDSEVDQMVLRFPIMADYFLLPAADSMVFATHGHVYHQEALPPMMPGDILLHGHTHVPAWKSFGDHLRYFNPGSVSIPKEGSCHSYMIFENGVFVWKDLETGSSYHEEKA